MVADEARRDWTTAAGSTDWIPVYAAPFGRLIAYLIDLNGNRTTEIRDWVDNFFITYSCCRPFNLPGQYFVDNYLIVADTDGNEAGSRTGVSVFFRPVKVGMLY